MKIPQILTLILNLALFINGPRLGAIILFLDN